MLGLVWLSAQAIVTKALETLLHCKRHSCRHSASVAVTDTVSHIGVRVAAVVLCRRC